MAKKTRTFILTETAKLWVLKEQIGRGQNIGFERLIEREKKSHTFEMAQTLADEYVGLCIRNEPDERTVSYHVDVMSVDT